MTRPAPLEVSVSRVIGAPAETVYDLVSDVTAMGDYSPENTGAVWLGGATGPRSAPASRAPTGSVRCDGRPSPPITAADRGRLFAFEVPGRARATWTYHFEPVPGGVRVTESMRQERADPAADPIAPATSGGDRPEPSTSEQA
jgi:hypothetical protein